METLTLKAVTTAETDEGLFEAVISSASVDREKDIVSPEGMVRALQRWVPTGKNLTLTWHHSTDPDKQIGYIDPSTARVQDGMVVASGWIDRSVPAGKDAWRLVKLGTLGFSFGYLTTKATPRQGGGRNLNEFDVFEVTATPIPMNPDTRVLGWKSMGATELRDKADAVAADAEFEVIERADRETPDEPGGFPAPPPLPRIVPEAEEQRRRAELTATEIRRTEDDEMVDELDLETPEEPPEPPPPPPPDPVPVPDARSQRRRAREHDHYDREATDEGLELLLSKAATTLSAEPFSSSRTSNWVARGGGLPHYIQHVAHDLVESHGMDVSKAIQMAIGIVKRWASGGGKVTAETRAKAAAAVAEWEKLKASARATPGKAMPMAMDEADAPDVPDESDDAEMQDYVDGLSDSEKAALFEALYSHMCAQMAGSAGKAIDAADQRERAEALIREEEGITLLQVTEDDMDGLAAGELTDNVKAQLTGRTKAIFDREAQARFEREQQLIEAAEIIASARADETDRDLESVRSVDLLRERAKAVELEFASGGESLRKPPQQEQVAPPRVPELGLDELQRRARDEMLIALSGVEEL